MATPAVAKSPSTTQYIWLFANARLNEHLRELIVDDEAIDVESKVLDALIFLLRHAGEIVTKDELLEGVWPGRVLTDSAIAKCVSRAREALGDRNQTIIKTVWGFGYQFIAPVEGKEVIASFSSALDLEVGNHPPLRPYWSLKEKLGAGGQGEVWRVQHDKTREQRVLKFALDSTNLASLKREITISRYLIDALGDTCEFLPIIDWNLEEAPFFLESRYVASGNLDQWVRAQGGGSQVPLPTRLEIAARIADALAHAHTVGVLHKDLKPSNVLVEPIPNGIPAIRLVDFGSAGISDVGFLEKLGITQMGFTASATVEKAATTALYLAPEVISGHQFTIQSDIFSLGVMLYQLVVGDFERQPAHGWESRVQDALIREDISHALAGDPQERLRDASELAKRIRTLDQRRQALADAEAARIRKLQEQEEAERSRRKAELDTERTRARRVWMYAAIAVLAIGTVTSSTLYFEAENARAKASRSAEISQAVAEFLSNDMFEEISNRPMRDLSVEDMLDAAAESLDSKLSTMPVADAKLHAALGRAYWNMERIEQAKTQLELALDGFRIAGLLGTDDAARAAAILVRITAGSGDYDQAEAVYEEISEATARSQNAHSPAFSELELEFAWVLYIVGEWNKSVDNLTSLVKRPEAALQPHTTIIAEASSRLGYVLTRLGRFSEAEHYLRGAKSNVRNLQTTNSILLADIQTYLGQVLMETGRLDEARLELAQAREAYQTWTASGSNAHQASAEFVLAQIAIQEGNSRAAIREIQRIIQHIHSWHYLAEVHSRLSLAYLASGDLENAEIEGRQALDLAEAQDGPEHPLSQGIRISLAGIVLLTQGLDAAADLLTGVSESRLESFGDHYPVHADYWKLIGLLAQQRGNESRAESYIALANARYEKTYGTSPPKSRELHYVSGLLEQRRGAHTKPLTNERL